MDVRSVMTENPATCQQDTPVREIARLMREHDCGLIPVVEKSGKPIGAVTDRDIALRIVAEGREPAQCTAQDCMTTPVTTIGQQSSLGDVANLMEEEQIRRVLIVDNDGRLAGIVAQADVALTGRDRKTAELVKEVSEPKRQH